MFKRNLSKKCKIQLHNLKQRKRNKKECNLKTKIKGKKERNWRERTNREWERCEERNLWDYGEKRELWSARRWAGSGRAIDRKGISPSPVTTRSSPCCSTNPCNYILFLWATLCLPARNGFRAFFSFFQQNRIKVPIQLKTTIVTLATGTLVLSLLLFFFGFPTPTFSFFFLLDLMVKLKQSNEKLITSSLLFL